MLATAVWNTKYYAALSTLAVNSSVMHDKEVAIQNIIKMAGWRYAETFATPCEKPFFLFKERQFLFKHIAYKMLHHAAEINQGNSFICPCAVFVES